MLLVGLTLLKDNETNYSALDSRKHRQRGPQNSEEGGIGCNNSLEDRPAAVLRINQFGRAKLNDGVVSKPMRSGLPTFGH